MTLKVELGSGYKADYKIHKKGSGGRFPDTIGRACGGAVTKVVTEVLNDSVVKEFLNRG